MSQSKNVIDLRGKPMRSLPANAPRLPLPEKKPRTPWRAWRKRIRLAIALAGLVLLALAGYGVSYVSYLPRFNIGSVSVSGADVVPPRLVQAYAETQLYTGSYAFISPDSVFLFNAGRLAREIAGYFPRIKSVQVSRASMFASSVEVTITERQPFALWCADAAQTDCYQLDDSGFIFAPGSVASSSSQYIFSGGIATSTDPIGKTFAPSHFPGLEALLLDLGQAGLSPLGASVQNDEDFLVPLAQGDYLKASFGEDPQMLVSNLQLILSSDALQGQTDQLEYVDLRFGDKVYYKLKGQDETTASSSAQ